MNGKAAAAYTVPTGLDSYIRRTILGGHRYHHLYVSQTDVTPSSTTPTPPPSSRSDAPASGAAASSSARTSESQSSLGVPGSSASRGAVGTEPAAAVGKVGSQRPPEADASIYLHPQTLARLGSFELRAKMIVEGLSSGLHRSPHQGLSVEFAQHRPYVPGDDLRHLDWKVFGRTDKLQLKQHQQETNFDLIIMVDASGSMSYGSRSFEDASGEGHTQSYDGRTVWSKFDHATAIAAALAYITLRQGDRVGLAVYSDEIRALVRRSSSQGTWRQIVGALSVHPAEVANRNKTTDLARSVDQVMGKVVNRCIIAVCSDFFVDIDTLRESLARLRHARHDVLLFQILDRDEEEFNFADTAPFEGLEGELPVRIDPRALRSAYLESFNAHNTAIEKLARSLGFDYQKVSTHGWLGPTLASFVAKRNAVMKHKGR